jgi:hypothetical protein
MRESHFIPEIQVAPFGVTASADLRAALEDFYLSLSWPKTPSARQRTSIGPAIYSIDGFRLFVEGLLRMSSVPDRCIRCIRSALESLKHASLQLPRPSQLCPRYHSQQ